MNKKERWLHYSWLSAYHSNINMVAFIFTFTHQHFQQAHHSAQSLLQLVAASSEQHNGLIQIRWCSLRLGGLWGGTWACRSVEYMYGKVVEIKMLEIKRIRIFDDLFCLPLIFFLYSRSLQFFCFLACKQWVCRGCGYGQHWWGR